MCSARYALGLVVMVTTAVHGQTIRFGTPDGYVVAEVGDRLRERSVDVTLDHHWVRGGVLLITQGGVGGTVLHGQFRSFHPSGQLREMGRFNHGLKDGEWRYWNDQGRIQLVQRWRAGRLHGIEQRSNEKGELATRTKYRNGQIRKVREKRIIQSWKAKWMRSNRSTIEHLDTGPSQKVEEKRSSRKETKVKDDRSPKRSRAKAEEPKSPAERSRRTTSRPVRR